MKVSTGIYLAISFAIVLASCKHSNEPAPVLTFTSFSPARGSVGSLITIAGTGFSVNPADNVVAIGSTTAIVTVADPTQLVVVVPSGAVDGKISVTVNQVTLQSATDFVVTDRWVTMADVGGQRDYGFNFAANGKGYVGAGNLSKKDFWEYDPATNGWTQKQDFKGEPRVYASGFGLGSKGYVTGGFSNTMYKDVWEYDPASNNWTQKSDFNAGERFASVVFTIGSKAYVAGGRVASSSTILQDFWEYNPATDSWTKKADIPGDPSGRAFGFAIGGTGFIGGGRNSANIAQLNFYQYDASLDQWTPKAAVPEEAQVFDPAPNTFASSTKGYVSADAGRQLWQYDLATNTWARRADPPAQIGGVGFTIGDYGYLGASYGRNFHRYTPE